MSNLNLNTHNDAQTGAAHASDTNADTPPDTQKPRILVIEDDLFFSARIESVLQKMGYAVAVIGDHNKAVQSAREHAPALVIINFGNDRLAPADTTRHLKELPAAPPVMGFVPHVWMPQVRPNAMAAGCDLLVANSALVMRLPQLVTKLLASDSTDQPQGTQGERGTQGGGKVFTADDMDETDDTD